MIPISEFQRRAETGPVMREQQFDLLLSKKVREIVQRYDIKFDKRHAVVDDHIANAVFRGGVDLLAEVGLYHKDTLRVVKLDRQEVEQIAKEVWQGPRQEVVGKDKDEVTIRYRTSEDPTAPAVLLGTATPSTEDLYIPYIQSFAQEELNKGLTSCHILSVGGVENKTGTAGEAICSLRQVALTLEVARRVGKPGMFLGLARAVSVGAVMACFFPGGLERHNATIAVHAMPELKIDWSRLVLAALAELRGIIPHIGASAIIGALCRGPEEAAVTSVASLLAQIGYSHGVLATGGATDISGAHSARGALWAYSAFARASERHIGIPMCAGSFISMAGACTEMSLLEKAAEAVTYIASGASWMRTVSCRGGSGVNTAAGLEARFVAETALAVAGMKRDKANELVASILPLYESNLSRPPEGKTFAECYDVQRVAPTAEYLSIYDGVKDKLTRLGLNYR